MQKKSALYLENCFSNFSTYLGISALFSIRICKNCTSLMITPVCRIRVHAIPTFRPSSEDCWSMPFSFIVMLPLFLLHRSLCLPSPLLVRTSFAARSKASTGSAKETLTSKRAGHNERRRKRRERRCSSALKEGSAEQYFSLTIRKYCA